MKRINRINISYTKYMKGYKRSNIENYLNYIIRDIGRIYMGLSHIEQNREERMKQIIMRLSLLNRGGGDIIPPICPNGETKTTRDIIIGQATPSDYTVSKLSQTLGMEILTT